MWYTNLKPQHRCRPSDDVMKKCRPEVKNLQVGYYQLRPVSVSECLFVDDIAIFVEPEKDATQF